MHQPIVRIQPDSQHEQPPNRRPGRESLASGHTRLWVLQSFPSVSDNPISLLRLLLARLLGASVASILGWHLSTTRERICTGILRQTRAQIQPNIAYIGFERFGGLGMAHSEGSQPRHNSLPQAGCETIEAPANA